MLVGPTHAACRPSSATCDPHLTRTLRTVFLQRMASLCADVRGILGAIVDDAPVQADSVLGCVRKIKPFLTC